MKLKSLAAVIAATVLIAGCEKAEQSAEQTVDDSAAGAQQSSDLATQEQKLSYIFGQNIGAQFAADDVEVNVDVFARGVQDALDGNESSLSEEEMMAVLQKFQEDKMAEQQQMMEEAAAKNKEEGEAFLTANAEKDGVVTLDSGLQYKVISEGEGPTPTGESTVSVHYKGTLIDGTEFDSSYKRGEPATFGVNQVIPGWTEALMLMPEGSKWELYIPPELAYGPGGAGQMIGPEATLVFEVELLSANAGEESDDTAEGDAEE